MRTISTTIYTIDELSDQAKERACQYVRDNWHDFYPWHTDNQASLEAFAKFVGGHATYSIQMSGYGPSHAKIDKWDWYHHDYDPFEWVNDNLPTKSCPFTGYSADEDLLTPMREFIQLPSAEREGISFHQLVDKCLASWVKSYVADWGHCYTNEYILDFFEANDFEFLQDGTSYNGR